MENQDLQRKPENFLSEQSLYQLGIGMLFYLVKHSWSDIANTVCNSTKDLMAQLYLHIMKCCTIYILYKNYRLKFDPIDKKNKPWDLVCYSDSDYVGYSDTRWSVLGFILYICRIPISWRSNAQQSVPLSSSEAIWVAMSKAVKEVIFVLQKLASMKIHIQYPIIVCVYNVGAIFIAQNITTISQTKHVDIRYKFVRKCVEERRHIHQEFEWRTTNNTFF